MASLAGFTLVWRGTALDRIWMLNLRAYRELSPLGRPVGFLFLSLAAVLAIGATGWLKRRRWGWRLAVLIIAAQILGDVVNICFGRIAQGATGVTLAGLLLLYITRRNIRASFVAMSKRIARSHDP